MRLDAAARIPGAAGLAHRREGAARLSLGPPPLRGERGALTRVAVVIPTYNQAGFVAEAVQSALDQTFRDREVVVVDDGSTDDTPAVLDGFGDQVRRLHQPNAGFAPAVNRGVRATECEYVAWLSSDDLFEPTKLERQVALLDRDPAADLVYTDVWEIDGTGRIVRELRAPWYADQRAFQRQMLWNNFVNGSSILMRRRAFEAVGGFPEYPRFAADGLMWLRMLARGSRFAHLPELLTRYRTHPGQGSRDRGQLQAELAGYYRRGLALFTLEDLFGDRWPPSGGLTAPDVDGSPARSATPAPAAAVRRHTWRADAHRELGDLLAYRDLTAMALGQYARSLAARPGSPTTFVAAARALARAARRTIRPPHGDRAQESTPLPGIAR